VQLLQLTDSGGAEEEQPAAAAAAAAAATAAASQAAAEIAADTEQACPVAVSLPELNITAGGGSCDATSCVVLVSQTSVKGKQQVVEESTSEQLPTAATEETEPAASSDARSAAAAEQSSSVLTRIPAATPAAETDVKAVGTIAVVVAATAAVGIPPLSPGSSLLPAAVPLLCQLSNSSIASAASNRVTGPNIGIDATSTLASAGASGAVAAGNANGRYSSAVLAAAASGDAQTSELVREMAVMKKLAHPHVVALHEVSTGEAHSYKQ
jgi:hypothetical protein